MPHAFCKMRSYEGWCAWKRRARQAQAVKWRAHAVRCIPISSEANVVRRTRACLLRTLEPHVDVNAGASVRVSISCVVDVQPARRVLILPRERVNQRANHEHSERLASAARLCAVQKHGNHGRSYRGAVRAVALVREAAPAAG